MQSVEELRARYEALIEQRDYLTRQRNAAATELLERMRREKTPVAKYDDDPPLYHGQRVVDRFGKRGIAELVDVTTIRIRPLKKDGAPSERLEYHRGWRPEEPCEPQS